MTDAQLAAFRALVDDQKAWGSCGSGSINRSIELTTLCPAALAEIDRLRAVAERWEKYEGVGIDGIGDDL